MIWVRPPSDLQRRSLTELERSLVDEIRLVGNHFFKQQQYRDAAMLYRSGLGLMALGPERLMQTQCEEGEEEEKDNCADAVPDMFLPPEDNRRAATLLLNLAQTLLNLSIPPRQTINAVEAARVSSKAMMLLGFIGIQRLEQILEKSTPTTAFVGEEVLHGLVFKAKCRTVGALERCANVAGAMSALIYTHDTGVPEERLLERMEDIIDAFITRDKHIKAIPGALWALISGSAECHHSARVAIGEVDQGTLKQRALRQRVKLEKMIGMFNCGFVNNGPMFVFRFSSKESVQEGGDSYLITQWRKDQRGEPNMFFWGIIFGDRRKPYYTGVVFEGCLLCLCLAEEDPHMICCPLRPDETGVAGSSRKVPLMFPDSRRLRRKTSSADVVGQLVVCGSAMYLFGGIDILDDGREDPSDELLKFVPVRAADGDIVSVSCTRVPVEDPPHPRWGHATFVHGDDIYFFGGTDGTEDVFGRQKIFTEMSVFDVTTGLWRTIPDQGYQPCARSAMGVASNGDRAVIVGGLTNARRGHQSVFWLADVWEYHFVENCWIQVAPQDRRQPWIVARQCAVCGIVGSDTLLVVGGYGMGNVNHTPLLGAFTYSPHDAALALHAGIDRKGPWRDLAVERACQAVAAAKLDLGRMPEQVQQLYGAPAGSVTLLTPYVTDTAAAAFAPCDNDPREGQWSEMPSGCAFSPQLELPVRPLSADSLWGAPFCPFDLPPRWLAPPNEVSVNLVSATPVDVFKSDQYSALSMRHTVKHFSTVKAAVEYFRRCQPNLKNKLAQDDYRNWCQVEQIDGIAGRIDCSLGPSHREWQLREIKAYYTCHYDRSPPSTGVLQLYLMMVFGHTFVCFLTQYPSIHVNTRDSSIRKFPPELCWRLAAQQVKKLIATRPHLVCCQCARPHPSAPELVKDPCLLKTKVCKGCHLVRYCSPECQLAAWPTHKAICSKHSAPAKGLCGSTK